MTEMIRVEFVRSEMETLFCRLADGVDEVAAFGFLRLEADRRGLVPIERPRLCPLCPDRPLPGTFWTMCAVTRKAWDREVGGA